MGCRGLIGRVNNSGSITFVYCHHDNMPENNGEILYHYYQDEAKVDKLLALGDMSSLGIEPIEDKDGWTKGHNYGMCTIYKTRGEDCPAATVDTLREYMHAQDDAEYLYLFKDNQWFVYDCYDEEGKGWQLVRDVIVDI